jgi:phage terminase large subunit-like protein
VQRIAPYCSTQPYTILLRKASWNERLLNVLLSYTKYTKTDDLVDAFCYGISGLSGIVSNKTTTKTTTELYQAKPIDTDSLREKAFR